MVMQPAKPRLCPACHGVMPEPRDESRGTTYYFKCKACGEFGADPLAANELWHHPDRSLISSWIRQRWEVNPDEWAVVLTTKLLREIALSLPRRLSASNKALLLLRHFRDKSTHPGKLVSFRPERDWRLCYAANESEFDFYVQHLVDSGYVNEVADARDTWTGVLTVAGIDAASQGPSVESINGFVAMWFHDDLKPAYTEGMEPAIRASQYEPIRIDGVEHLEGITDRIMAEIRESRFVVADVTGARYGVYYEAGFATGLGIPVIYCCRKGNETDMHFDTKHLSHIIWETPEDLAERLENRIVATIGRGPLESPEKEATNVK